jgi:hypothetical protein
MSIRDSHLHRQLGLAPPAAESDIADTASIDKKTEPTPESFDDQLRRRAGRGPVTPEPVTEDDGEPDRPPTPAERGRRAGLRMNPNATVGRSGIDGPNWAVDGNMRTPTTGDDYLRTLSDRARGREPSRVFKV